MTSRAHRRSRGAVAVLALALPLSAIVVAGTATPALASGSITSPAADQVYDDSNANPAGTNVAVKASVTVSPGKTATLTVSGPGYSGQPSSFHNGNVIGSQSSTLTVNITLLASRANGKYTAVLSGDASGSRSFYTNFAPTSAPDSVTAQGSGASRVDVSWGYNGSEPASDIAGFEISDGQGNTFSAAGSDRSYTALYDNPTPGTYDYHYTVRALRKSGNGGSSVAGAWSSPVADAQLVTPQPPPSPTPTPSPTSGGTTGSTTGSSTTGSSTGGSSGSTTGSTSSTTGGSTGGSSGGTTGTKSTTGGGSTGSASKPIVIPTLPPLVASRRSFALSFNHFSPSLGIPKLPPLPATTFPETAPGENGYQPVLPYTAQPRKTTNVLTSPIATISDNFDLKKAMPAIAFALILFAAAAHVRVFLSHSAED